MTGKMLGLHAGIYGLAAILAWRASVSDDDAGRSKSEVDLWKSDSSSIKRIHYKDDQREVELRPRTDEFGTYVVGSVTSTTPAKPVNPHVSGGDAGVNPQAETASEQTTKEEHFIGVTEANELLGNLASLSAIRSFGSVTPDKLEDFALTGEETGTLTVEFDTGTRELLFGGRTPGGGDFYVQDKASGSVYVVNGDVRRDVELADTRLMERELLTEGEGQVVEKVVLTHGDKARAIVRSKEHASFWTDESTPAEKDETLTNWMKKFERLRVNEYIQGEPEAYEPLVMATFQSAEGEQLGRIEFGKQQLTGDDEPRFLARSPQTRWWGVVLTSSGSQLAQDLPTVLE